MKFVADIELSLTLEELQSLKKLSIDFKASVEEMAHRAMAEGIKVLSAKDFHDRIGVALKDISDKAQVEAYAKDLKVKAKGPARKKPQMVKDL